MAVNNLAKNILSDVKVELTEEFDRNFERKAFFDQPWEHRKRDGNGSLLLVTGRLRRSIRSQTSGNSIKFFSDSEYADIHNNGGTIPVTPKMKKYFYYRYYQVRDPDAKIPAKGSDAQFWACMAKAKKITIPQRQFIGKHPKVTQIVKEVANECTKECLNKIFNDFKTKLNR